ncbi:uncharacterized protein LOC5575427 isoform X3 [Aedes aegypti]|uniref:Uncharacterized protein n=1 Tax=Aedes aegypti TaxID=7159 RepID=A0A6I8U0L3_AEDAE|nr:uncharacterized protein LOC5575427 isoform X3 [Aedes aegypti]
MSQRNLTDLYSMLRNNVVYNKHLYTDTNNSDHIALLDHGLNEADDPEQPAWIRIYDDIVCLLTRTQTKIDDLVHIQDAPARLVLNENGGDELKPLFNHRRPCNYPDIYDSFLRPAQCLPFYLCSRLTSWSCLHNKTSWPSDVYSHRHCSRAPADRALVLKPADPTTL